MCNFLSGIAFKNGDVTCLPEYTHSHSDLIRHLCLIDENPELRSWCRVEFSPPAAHELDEVDKYKLIVDDVAPSWWADVQEGVEKNMRRIVTQIIIAEDRDFVLGGFWIVGKGIKINVAKAARIHVMLDSSQVGKMLGSSHVGEMRGSSQVGKMWDSSQVGEMWGSSHVGEMRGSSQVGEMLGSSQVGEMWDSSQVGKMWGSSQVGKMWDSSQVGEMLGSSQVGEMLDSSQVGKMWGSSHVGEMRDSSQVGEMCGSSHVRCDKRNGSKRN